MNPEQINRLDRLVGKPLCALLTGYERVRRALSRRKAEPPRRILFVKLIEMGSTVLACPAFREAERLVGRENLFILVFEENRPIVDLLPFFPPENVLTVRRDSLTDFARGLLGVMRRTRRERIDTALDMEGLTRSSAIITWLTGARNRVGFYNFTSEGPYRGRLFTHELNPVFQHHTSELFLALVRALVAEERGVPRVKERVEPGPLPRFEPSSSERAAVREILDREAGRPVTERLVLLNPNCSDLLPLRRWATERFVELGRRLLAAHDDLMIVVTGAPSEREEAEALARQIGSPGRVICTAGRTSLRQLLVLYGESELLVSNDSGPVHFAALTQVRVVALFGPETPLLYGPLGEHVTNLTANLACSPCVNMLNHRFSPCTDNVCMQELSVDLVLDAAERQLAGASGRALRPARRVTERSEASQPGVPGPVRDA